MKKVFYAAVILIACMFFASCDEAVQLIEEVQSNAASVIEETAEAPVPTPTPAPVEEQTEEPPAAAAVEDEFVDVVVAVTCVKLRLGSKLNNLFPVLEIIEETVAETNPDIVVLSESIFTRMNPDGLKDADKDTGKTEELGGPVFEAIAAKAMEHEIYIVFNVNAPYESKDEPGRLFYNSNFLVSPDGEIIGRYDKNKLPPDEITLGLTPGTERPVFDIEIRGKTVTVGMLICYDFAREAYAEGEVKVAQTLAESGASLILASSIGDYVYEAVIDAANGGVFIAVAGQDRYMNDDYAASAIIAPDGSVILQFTDRTGLPNQSYEQMQYRKGQDGSFESVALRLPVKK